MKLKQKGGGAFSGETHPHSFRSVFIYFSIVVEFSFGQMSEVVVVKFHAVRQLYFKS